MGGSASTATTWECDAASISRPGETCVLSGPITGLSPDAILDAVERYVRGRPLMTEKYEANRDVKDLKDGGLHECCHIEVTGLANLVVGSISLKLHAVYDFQKDKDTLTLKLFHTDETLTTPMMVNVVKILREPECRIESFTDEFETRQAGPFLRNKLQRQLGAMGYPGECAYEAPSPSEPGKKCVLSPELPDPGLTPAMFWERLRSVLEEQESGAVLPDGTVVVEESGLLFKEATYLKYSFLEGSGLVMCQDYLGDEQMERVGMVYYYKVLDSPKRVEAWVMTSNGRRSGGGQRETVQRLLEGALSMAAASD